MDIKWRQPKARGSKGRQANNYEVALTLTTNGRTSGNKKSLNITFRNRAFRKIQLMEARRLRVSEIDPNKDKIYFDFVLDGDNEEGSYKLTNPNVRNKRQTASTVKFTVDNDEAFVIENFWVEKQPCGVFSSYYQLLREDEYFYIERKNEQQK